MLIFLDMDGVMIPIKSWKPSELLDDGFPAFSLKATATLQKLISEDTTIILTTSHKSRFSITEWKKIFHKRGIEISKLKSLDENINHLSRKNEILNWFNLNNVSEEFIIIDDDKSLNELPLYIREKLISTSPMIGLTEDYLDKINKK